LNSIEGILNRNLTASLLLIFVGFWWVSIMTIHQITEDYLITRLAHDSVSIEKHLRAHTQQSVYPQIDYTSLNPIYDEKHSGHYFVIEYKNKIIESNSLANFSLFLKVSPHLISHYETKGPAEDNLFVYRYKTEYRSAPLVIYIAEDNSPVKQALIHFDILIGGFALLALFLVYWQQRYILRKGFKQLEPIHDALEKLHTGEAVQLEVSDYPIEVAELIDNLNQALQSASRQLQRSRQSNANLAHSLKTPLNLIYQLLNDPAFKDYPALKETLKQQAERIHARVESELKRARLAAHAHSVQPFDFRTHLPDLIETLQQLYPQKRFHIPSFQNKTPPPLAIKKEDGFELLGNLLDNATKFSHENVYLSIHQQLNPDNNAETITYIDIEDYGEGVPSEQLDRIQNRGHRLDESISGHGIGLSIVKQIAEAYEFEISFGHSQYGGLCVRLKLIQSAKIN